MDWHSEKAKKLFISNGIATAEDFMAIETKLPEASLTLMRRHDSPCSGKNTRDTFRITLDDNIFYLKKGYGDSIDMLRNESEAVGILPQFGLTPPTIAAKSLDSSNKGFLLLDNLKDFHSIKEILKKNAPQSLQDQFLDNKDEFFRKISECIKNTFKAGYIYADWLAKHLFVRENSREVALIDLERFRHANKSPWYFSFPVTSLFVKNKIMKKLRTSLVIDSDKLSHKYLKKFF
ncbi:MAG: hypothetical protein JW808_09585 [Victivallales bacterium]|nr:hypothetical protein [Victivallales bacterium]